MFCKENEYRVKNDFLNFAAHYHAGTRHSSEKAASGSDVGATCKSVPVVPALISQRWHAIAQEGSATPVRLYRRIDGPGWCVCCWPGMMKMGCRRCTPPGWWALDMSFFYI